MTEEFIDERGTIWKRYPGNQTFSTVTNLEDPAQALLQDGHFTVPTVFKAGCYICEDPEFARMGLPLCRKCDRCGGHVAADDTVCDDCGWDEMDAYERRQLTVSELTIETCAECGFGIVTLAGGMHYCPRCAERWRKGQR